MYQFLHIPSSELLYDESSPLRNRVLYSFNKIIKLLKSETSEGYASVSGKDRTVEIFVVWDRLLVQWRTVKHHLKTAPFRIIHCLLASISSIASIGHGDAQDAVNESFTFLLPVSAGKTRDKRCFKYIWPSDAKCQMLQLYVWTVLREIYRRLLRSRPTCVWKKYFIYALKNRVTEMFHSKRRTKFWSVWSTGVCSFLLLKISKLWNIR